MEPLSEKDWRAFKALKASALERYSAMILITDADLERFGLRN